MTTDIHDAMANLMWHIEHYGTETVIDQIDDWIAEPDSEGHPWHSFLAEGVKNAIRQAKPLQSGITVISIRHPKDEFQFSFEFRAGNDSCSDYKEALFAAVESALRGD